MGWPRAISGLKTHEKPAFSSSLRKYRSQNPSRCEKVMQTSLINPAGLVYCFFTIKKVNQRKSRGTDITIYFQEPTQSETCGTTTAMFFVRRRSRLQGAAPYRKHLVFTE